MSISSRCVEATNRDVHCIPLLFFSQGVDVLCFNVFSVVWPASGVGPLQFRIWTSRMVGVIPLMLR